MSFCAFSESQVFLNDFYSIGCFPLLGNDAALSTDLVDEFMVRALSIWAGLFDCQYKEPRLKRDIKSLEGVTGIGQMRIVYGDSRRHCFPGCTCIPARCYPKVNVLRNFWFSLGHVHMLYATKIKRKTCADFIVFAAAENSWKFHLLHYVWHSGICLVLADCSCNTRSPILTTPLKPQNNLLLALVLGVARIVMGFAGNLWLFPFFFAFILFI